VGLARVLPASPLVSGRDDCAAARRPRGQHALARLVGLGRGWQGARARPVCDRAAVRRQVGAAPRHHLMGMKGETSFFWKERALPHLRRGRASRPQRVLRRSRPGVRSACVAARDLLAGGTHICGASAVNAIAPSCAAHREEQAVAIAVMFPLQRRGDGHVPAPCLLVGLDPAHAGAVERPCRQRPVERDRGRHADGRRMGASAESWRRPRSRRASSCSRRCWSPSRSRAARDRRTRSSPPARTVSGHASSRRCPGFFSGTSDSRSIRALGDRTFGHGAAWEAGLSADRLAVDLLMAAVSAGIGLHLSLRSILGSSARAVGVGGGASLWDRCAVARDDHGGGARPDQRSRGHRKPSAF